jgi:hypothetical protein
MVLQQTLMGEKVNTRVLFINGRQILRLDQLGGVMVDGLPMRIIQARLQPCD